MSKNDRIVSIFMGHTHKNQALLLEGFMNKYLFDLGGYAYAGEETSTGYSFDNYYDSIAWGFGVLEWNEDEVHYYHVKYPRTYTGANGTFNYVGAIEDDVVIKLN